MCDHADYDRNIVRVGIQIPPR